MNVSNLEGVIPGLAELRYEEHQNRALEFAGLTHTLCGVEVSPLTPGARLRLQLLRNAFLSFAAPMAGDVFQLLWLLSPGYRAPGQGSRLVAEYRQWKLRKHVRSLVLADAIREIKEYFIRQLQDAPESSGEDGQDYSQWVHWMASEAAFWLNLHGGFTLESYQRTPYLLLQQLRRMWQINHPKMTRNHDGSLTVEEPQFINASDRLVTSYQRAHMAAIREYMLAQRTRRE